MYVGFNIALAKKASEERLLEVSGFLEKNVAQVTALEALVHSLKLVLESHDEASIVSFIQDIPVNASAVLKKQASSRAVRNGDYTKLREVISENLASAVKKLDNERFWLKVTQERLAAARDEFDVFTESMIGRVDAQPENSTRNSLLPSCEDEATRIIDVDDVPHLTWISWPTETTHINYGSLADAGIGSGLGPGEERVALALGGKIQGGNVSFDVIAKTSTGNIKRIEVKQLKHSSDQIRTCIDGREVYDVARYRMMSIMDQMTAFAQKIDEDNIRVWLDTVGTKMTKRGEITQRNMYTFIKVIKNIRELARDSRYVGLVEFLKDDVFTCDQPDDFVSWWASSIKPSNVFKHVDYVVIVNEEKGMNFIPRNMLDDVLVLVRISQGLPRFVFTKF